MKLLIFSVFYNRERQVKTSISSVLKAAPENAKVILVDDGSTDQTLKELNQFKSDKRVIVETSQNQGFTNALKQAINKYADVNEFTYMAVHGSGDICSPEKFSKQLKYLENHPEIVALGTGHTVESYTTKNKVLIEEGYYEATLENLRERVPFTHGTVVYRLREYLEVGGYSPVFKYSQDKDLYVKLIQKGKIVRYPDSLYTQFIFEDSASSNPYKKREQIKYQKLLFLDRSSKDSEYFDKVNQLQNNTIHEVFSDEDFIDNYLNAQKRLIYQGEFKLASQWCDLIFSVNQDSKQKRLKKILRSLDKSKTVKWLTAKSFYNGRKLLK